MLLPGYHVVLQNDHGNPGFNAPCGDLGYCGGNLEATWVKTVNYGPMITQKSR